QPPVTRPSASRTKPSVTVATKTIPKSPVIPGMYVQLGAFSSTANASRLKADLTVDYPTVSVQPFMRDMRQMYRVRIGPYSDVRNIERTVLLLQQQGHGNAIVVIE
ncbi:MAG: SPOR domain-containing protein, partial [Mariprofundaceae bacterium]